MSDLLWMLGAIAVCGGLLYVAHRIEPHWVAKDGGRFLTTAELIDRFGNVIGRRREVRGAFLPDGALLLSRRSLVRTTKGVWRIRAKSPRPPRGKQVYVLSAVPPDPDGDMLALRVPSSSRLVALLDQLTPVVDPNDPPCRQRSDTRSTKSAMGSPIWSRLMRKASWPCGESISTYRLHTPSDRSISSI